MKFIRQINSVKSLLLILLFSFGVPAQTADETAEKVKENLQAGLQFVQEQKFAEAVAPLQTVLFYENDNEAARKALALALIGTDRFAEASREIAKLLAKNPSDEKLLEFAAQNFLIQKRYREAETVLRRRIELGNLTPEIWARFGDVLDAQKKTDEAIAAYEKASALAPDSITLRYALGALFWKAIRYDEAEKVFLEILKREPNEPRASFNLGDIYLTRGEAEKAVPFLETAMKAFPDEFDTRFALGRAFLAIGNAEKAVEELQTAVKLNPKIAEGFYHLGRALQRAGQTVEAKKATEKAKELQKMKLESESLENRKPR
jgi:tetratricopeptide (TPR) repeat protein